jgi:uncharacterized protein (DUF2147 family)
MKTATLLASMLMLMNTSAFADSSDPAGLWLMGNGKVTVKVVRCGGDKICGNIVGLEHTLNSDGTEKLDFKNPNPALRSRRVIGLQVFGGMAPYGDNRWKGKIYSADDGGTYRAYATLNGNAMEVKGCWGPFCKDIHFTRIK